MVSSNPPPARASQGLLIVAVLLASLLTVVVAAIRSAPAAAADRSAVGIPGRGATVPFVEQEAEDATFNGTLIGPDRRFTTLPSEASGRRAVRLDAAGQFVEFTLTQQANAMVVRYSVPDNAAGTGITAPISLLVNGSAAQTVQLTSRYG